MRVSMQCNVVVLREQSWESKETQRTVLMSLPELLTMVMVASSGRPAGELIFS